MTMRMSARAKFFLYLFLIFMVILTVIPLLYTVSASFKTNMEIATGGINLIPKTFTFDNYKTVWSMSGTGIASKVTYTDYTINSIKVSLMTVVLVVLFTSMSAYCFQRGKHLGAEGVFRQGNRRHWYAGAPLQRLRNPGGIGSYYDVGGESRDGFRVGRPVSADGRKPGKNLPKNVAEAFCGRRASFAFLHADNSVRRAGVGGTAQRARTDANRAPDFLRDLHAPSRRIDYRSERAFRILRRGAAPEEGYRRKEENGGRRFWRFHTDSPPFCRKAARQSGHRVFPPARAIFPE